VFEVIRRSVSNTNWPIDCVTKLMVAAVIYAAHAAATSTSVPARVNLSVLMDDSDGSALDDVKACCGAIDEPPPDAACWPAAPVPAAAPPAAALAAAAAESMSAANVTAKKAKKVPAKPRAAVALAAATPKAAVLSSPPAYRTRSVAKKERAMSSPRTGASGVKTPAPRARRQ
jgi:hypothetical protein